MSSISFLSYVTDPGDVGHSRITDLVLITLDGLPQLYSSTRYDGVLRQWVIEGGTLEIGATLGFGGNLIIGGKGGIVPLLNDMGGDLLVGGSADGGMQSITLDPAGGFGTSVSLTTLPTTFDGFQNGGSIALSDGSQVVFGTLAGLPGLAQLRFSSEGVLIDHAVMSGGQSGNTVRIADTVTLTAGGQSFVLTVSEQTNTVTAWAIDETGGIASETSIGAGDGLWIGAPTALETATVNGVTYAIVAAAGSDSLTVIEIDADGTMIVRDHILDARETRFGGVTSLEVIEADGKTYVIAGGADDGISVFLLLEGGLLVHRDLVEDTDDFGLNNVSAIAAHERTSGIDIFVASSSEPGLTHLLFDTGPAGITATATLAGGLLEGTVGNDILQGHDGNDVIAGGEGADLFILSADGTTDTITDFTMGEDSIDLSLWPMLRDISQLFITLQEDGMRISYGDEVLYVQSADGGPIDYRLLSTTDLIGASRLPVNLTPGYPGPLTPVPIIGEPPAAPPSDQGGPNNALTPLQIITGGNLTTLRDTFDASETGNSGSVLDGSDGADILTGSDQFDLILAGDGDDTAQGQGGDDTILGRDGDDILSGDDGSDMILGGTGADTLIGGNGQDVVIGGLGDDVVDGGAGDDLLIGDAGADTFVFNFGNDIIVDFDQGVDQIVLDPALWTGLTSAADVLFVYGTIADGRATIDFGDGNILTIDGITNPAGLADDISLF